jgi:hypothetical protein
VVQFKTTIFGSIYHDHLHRQVNKLFAFADKLEAHYNKAKKKSTGCLSLFLPGHFAANWFHRI